MSTKLIALTLALSMLGLGGVADARTAGARHSGASHHGYRSAGHVRHAHRLARRAHRTHRVYVHRLNRGINQAYATHRGHRHVRRYNHSYVYQPTYLNRGLAMANWRYNRSNLGRYRTSRVGGSNSITVPATITLPRSAVS